MLNLDNTFMRVFHSVVIHEKPPSRRSCKHSNLGLHCLPWSYLWDTRHKWDKYYTCITCCGVIPLCHSMSSNITLVVNSSLGRVKRICVFEHSVMINCNCACPAIQRGQGSGFLSECSSWLTTCMSEQRRFWRDCADAQARLNLRCSHRR